MAKSLVIAGDYLNYDVVAYGNKLSLMRRLKKIPVTKSVVSRYEVVDNTEQHPFWRSMVRGAVGGALLGSVGMIAGMASTAPRQRVLVSIEFTDGKKSLLDVSAEEYRSIILALY